MAYGITVLGELLHLLPGTSFRRLWDSMAETVT